MLPGLMSSLASFGLPLVNLITCTILEGYQGSDVKPFFWGAGPNRTWQTGRGTWGGEAGTLSHQSGINQLASSVGPVYMLAALMVAAPTLAAGLARRDAAQRELGREAAALRALRAAGGDAGLVALQARVSLARLGRPAGAAGAACETLTDPNFAGATEGDADDRFAAAAADAAGNDRARAAAAAYAQALADRCAVASGGSPGWAALLAIEFSLAMMGLLGTWLYGGSVHYQVFLCVTTQIIINLPLFAVLDGSDLHGGASALDSGALVAVAREAGGGGGGKVAAV